jgi:hypothetical protein
LEFVLVLGHEVEDETHLVAAAHLVVIEAQFGRSLSILLEDLVFFNQQLLVRVSRWLWLRSLRYLDLLAEVGDTVLLKLYVRLNAELGTCPLGDGRQLLRPFTYVDFS